MLRMDIGQPNGNVLSHLLCARTVEGFLGSPSCLG